MLNSRFWKKIGKAILLIPIYFLMAYGILKLGIDFINFWDTPRLADWEPKQRAVFLLLWVFLSGVLALFVRIADE